MSDYILEINDVTRSFPGIMALKGVSFPIKRGTVHCIVGENGAGKSTLIKILAGVQKSSSGVVTLNGEVYSPSNTREALHKGVSVLFQELNVIEQLTVEENMTLGTEKRKFGVLQRAENIKELEEILHSIDPSIHMNDKVAMLSVGKRQILQIAKAIAAKSEILIMDEPTAALSEDETGRLMEIVDDLKAQGITIIYISHKFEEIFRAGDYVTVLLDGRVVITQKLDQMTHEELVKAMLGKVVSEKYVAHDIDTNSVALRVSNLKTPLLCDMSFTVHQGEILGFYGLLGAGKTETARAIIGLDPYAGDIEMAGNVVKFKGPKQAFEKGVCFVPEERRTQGIVANLSIRENITLTNPKKVFKGGVRSILKEKAISKEYIEKLSIACRSEEQAIAHLSGGNQQKVVFAKCLNSDFDIMLLDEPTRGVDMGAKEEIHNIVRELAIEGKSFLVFSSELPEILNLCDRICIMYEGKIKAIIKNDTDIDAEKIMHVALGGTYSEAK